MDAVVFDKTGTLTRGRPTVTDCRLFGSAGVSLPMLCRCVGAAESASEHPLARALLEYCRAQLILAGDYRPSMAGAGGADGSASGKAGGSSKPGSRRTSMVLSHSGHASEITPLTAGLHGSAGLGGKDGKRAPSLDSSKDLSAHHAAALAAVLPKAQHVQVLPGVGITCQLPWDQILYGAAHGSATGASSGGSTMAAALGMSAASTGDGASGTPKSAGGAAVGGAGGCSVSAGGAKAGGRKGLVKVAVGNRTLMQQENVAVPDQVGLVHHLFICVVLAWSACMQMHNRLRRMCSQVY